MAVKKIITEEMIAKWETAKTAEELMGLAKEAGEEFTSEQAERL